MNQPPASFDPRRFRSTVPYYAPHRLGYPEPLVARAGAIAGIRPGDAVLDLGCGPGLLAVPFAKAGMKVTAIDPEPDMLEAAERAARAAGVAITCRLGSSFAMPPVGPFKLIAMGRAFHWMDGAATLDLLETFVAADGALAFFDDDHPPTRENAWWRALRKIAEDYGRNLSPHLVAAHSPDFRTHHALLLDSAFSRLEGTSMFVKRELSADEVVGLAFSLSTSSRARLGARAEVFEADLRACLRDLSPDGRFTEIAELSALIARRS
jgi:SAM-dependent methyltransferase